METTEEDDTESRYVEVLYKYSEILTAAKVGGTSTDGLHFCILTSASLRAIRHCPGPQM